MMSEGINDVTRPPSLPSSSDLLRWLPMFLPQGVEVIMIESEGITEQVSSPRYDVVATIMAEVGQQHVMFEAAEPQVFSW